MPERASALSLCVRTTVGLLLAGAYLVVLGLFNGYLQWDIFSPRVEKVLWGVFGSCLALGAFGVAITLVLGIHEVVAALRRLLERVPSEGSAPTPPLRRPNAWWLGVLAGVLMATVGGLTLLNQRIERQRTQVFKAVVKDQMKLLSPRFGEVLGAMTKPCEACVPSALSELMRTVKEQPSSQSVVLFVADPTDPAFLWRYVPASTYTDKSDRLEREFVATDGARAVRKALDGESGPLDQLNKSARFVWSHVFRSQDGRPLAVLKVKGNPKESFRDYQSIAAGVPDTD